jgi:DNA-binding NtrC family response regulator
MQPSAAHILILDDEADVAYAASLLLRRHVARVDNLPDPSGLPRYLEQGVPDVVLLDFNFAPGQTDGAAGLAALRTLAALPRPPAVIALTAYADVALAVEAMKAGACDFLTKPWDNARLLATVEQACARRPAAVPVAAGSDDGSGDATALMGDAPAMRQLRNLVAHVAPTEANIMVLGENGVGKELVARAIHRQSRRAGRPFLALDMGALPEATLESELFGHRKGAFTDARQDRAGRFRAASGGTLFLDEIGNLPLPAQAKLLTALERREVTPLGADRAHAIDVRIVSATNLAESALHDAAVFRPDLLFRLNTIVVRVPPLRERRGDIPLLLAHYLEHYQARYERPPRPVAPAASALLHAHDWPGNVRALRHACERAVILCQGDAYGADDFGIAGPAPAAVQSTPASASAEPHPRTLETLERDAVAAALDTVQGNISRAARLLGVSRAALYRKLDKHGL